MKAKFCFCTYMIGSICLLFSFSAGAQDNSFEVTPFYSEKPLQTDGRLIETIWEQAPVIEDFGAMVGSASPNLKTQVRLVRDDSNLYIGVVCYDPVADFIQVEAEKHDQRVWEDESIHIFLSPTGSNESFIRFCVNPYSVRSETLFPEESLEWDCWWEAKANKRKGYWMAEIRIPFAGLWTGSGQQSDVWGLAIMRYIERSGALQSWTPIDENSFLPECLGKMKGMGVDLSPFAVTSRVKEISPAVLGENPLVLTVENLTDSRKRLRIKLEIIDEEGKVAYEYKDIKVRARSSSDETIFYTLHKNGIYIVNVFVEDLKSREVVSASMDIPVALVSLSEDEGSKKGIQ